MKFFCFVILLNFWTVNYINSPSCHFSLASCRAISNSHNWNDEFAVCTPPTGSHCNLVCKLCNVCITWITAKAVCTVRELGVDQILLRTMSGTGQMKRVISPQIVAAVMGQWRRAAIKQQFMSDDLLVWEAWVLPNLWELPSILLLRDSETLTDWFLEKQP